MGRHRHGHSNDDTQSLGDGEASEWRRLREEAQGQRVWPPPESPAPAPDPPSQETPYHPLQVGPEPAPMMVFPPQAQLPEPAPLPAGDPPWGIPEAPVSPAPAASEEEEPDGTPSRGRRALVASVAVVAALAVTGAAVGVIYLVSQGACPKGVCPEVAAQRQQSPFIVPPANNPEVAPPIDVPESPSETTPPAKEVKDDEKNEDQKTATDRRHRPAKSPSKRPTTKPPRDDPEPSQSAPEPYRPPKVTGLRGSSPGSGNIQLSWNPIPEVFYWVYVRDVTAGQSGFTKMDYPATKPSADLGGFTPGHAYEFRVQATEKRGDGPLSDLSRVSCR